MMSLNVRVNQFVAWKKVFILPWINQIFQYAIKAILRQFVKTALPIKLVRLPCIPWEYILIGITKTLIMLSVDETWKMNYYNTNSITTVSECLKKAYI